MELTLFQTATKNSFRYPTQQGQVTTEDLWDMSLEKLDLIAKTLDKQVKESEETSFIKTRSRSSKEVKDKFDVVIEIINYKLEKKELLKNQAAVKAQEALINEKIQKKKEAQLDDKTLEELEVELNALRSRSASLVESA